VRQLRFNGKREFEYLILLLKRLIEGDRGEFEKIY
jgi:hypothetical protein